MISVRVSPELLSHLGSFEHDGATVASALFGGDRLLYPGRRELEYMLGYTEPYTLEHEARVIEGLSAPVQAAVRVLSRTLRRWLQLSKELEPTLELLWVAHEAYGRVSAEISIDRLVAALTMVQRLTDTPTAKRDAFVSALEDAAATLLRGLESEGFFPSSDALEELFDGAPPACVGLGLVDIDWKGE